jgi:hypothetical protein
MLPHRVHHSLFLDLSRGHASEFSLVPKLPSLPSLSSLSGGPQKLGPVAKRIGNTIVTDLQEFVRILTRVVVEEDVGSDDLASLVVTTLLFDFIEGILLVRIAAIAAKTRWDLGTHFLVVSPPVHPFYAQQLKLLTL